MPGGPEASQTKAQQAGLRRKHVLYRNVLKLNLMAQMLAKMASDAIAG
jgi:hypothetical protein